jgi:hypothetical protein
MQLRPKRGFSIKHRGISEWPHGELVIHPRNRDAEQRPLFAKMAIPASCFLFSGKLDLSTSPARTAQHHEVSACDDLARRGER